MIIHFFHYLQCYCNHLDYNKLILQLTVMKTQPPPQNAVIATLYLVGLLATGYLIKMTIKPTPSLKKAPKLNPTNLQKALSATLFKSEINPIAIVFKSFLLKYTFIGGFLNSEKLHLLKEVFIFGILLVACISINTITLWPIALALVAVLVFIVLMQIFAVPLSFKNTVKVQESSNRVEAESGQILSQDILGQRVKAPSEQQTALSIKYLVFLGIISFATLLMIANAMFAVYYSVSNLGALNFGSVAIIILIDQIGFRMLIGGSLCLAAKLMLMINSSQSESEEFCSLNIFHNKFFRNLCQQVLLLKMNQIYLQKGEPDDLGMGASPIKKKTHSPSKVPKAQPALYFEAETLMNLQSTKRNEEEDRIQQIGEQEEQKEEDQDHRLKTPIKGIQISQDGNNSIILTSAEKEMFQEDEHNNQQNNNGLNELYDEEIEIGPGHFFTTQKAPKLDSQQTETLGDDGLLLMQAGMNMIRGENVGKFKTMDVDFSPERRRRGKIGGIAKKKRQLIITGSSPYLQYLPDMMKKTEKGGRKSITPSQPVIPNISRKVL